MGLNDQLNPLLDEIESGNNTPQELKEKIEKVNQISEKAIAEANQFYATLS